MSLEFVPSDYFATELKRLAKRYRGLADDYEAFLDSLKEKPIAGDGNSSKDPQDPDAHYRQRTGQVGRCSYYHI